MSDLIKYSDAGLSDLEKSVINAQQAKKVIEASERDLKNAITSGVTSAMFNLGVKAPTDKEQFEAALNERKILESRILIDIKFHFKGLTTEDIKNAFELGSKGEFKSKPEDVLFLSPEKIFSWLKAYKAQVKEPVLKKKLILDQKQSKQREYSEEERQKMIKEAEVININRLKEEYEKFLQGGKPDDPVNVLYDFLDKKGLVRLSNARKREIWVQARQEYVSGHSSSNTIGEYFENKKILDEVEKGTDRIEAILKSRAKQKALAVIFQDIKDLEITIDEYLSDSGTD